MAQFAIPASSSSSVPSNTAGQASKSQPARFAELESKDSVVRYWAAKAVQVLDNEDLSEQGRVRIVRDIQERIAARLSEIGATGARAKTAKGVKAPKPTGLGCSQQMARLRESFRQFEAPVALVEKAPVKKVRLAPRMSKAA